MHRRDGNSAERTASRKRIRHSQNVPSNSLLERTPETTTNITFLHSLVITPTYTVFHKNDTDAGRYNFDVRQPIVIILAEMSRREYAIRYFPTHLSNVSALPGEA